MSGTKPGTSSAIADSVAGLKAAMHSAGRYAQGERGRRLALGLIADRDFAWQCTVVDEWLVIPPCKERRHDKATADLEASGWRFLPAPRFIERSRQSGCREFAPALEWEAPRWAAIPPEGSDTAARTFTRKGEAIAWARSAMERAGA